MRALALLGAVLFLVSGVRDALAHVDCPHHEAYHHGEVEAPPAHPHGGHAAHDAAPGAHESVPEAPAHGCTCLGPCHAGSAASLAAADPAAPHFAEQYLAPARLPCSDATLPGRPSFTLPYAQAPPVG